jgi:hypothetical protein
MFVVGIAAFARSIDEEVPALASDLGLSAYDTRQILAPGLPAVVLITAEKARALELLGRLRRRGHDVLAFDASAVVSSAEMVSSRRFHFEADALIADDPPEQRLPYADITVLARATHQTNVESTTTLKKKSFSMGRALLTGGLVMRKTKETSTTTRTEDRENVLYLFRRSGSTPWLLREHGTRHDGLGDRMAPTEHANFITMVELIRSHASGAVYDDRLVNRKVPDRIAQSAAQLSTHERRFETNAEAGMDLLVHLLAMWLTGRSREPSA